MKKLLQTAIAALALFLVQPTQSEAPPGKALFDTACGVCHLTGIAGAPRYGDATDWAPRRAGGMARLYESALQGTAKGMPPKGGQVALPGDDIKAAVDYMLAAVQDAPAQAAPATAAPPAAPPPTIAGTEVTAAPAGGATNVNAFNRLLRPPGKRNLPPTEDGIHDPANDGTEALQPPMAAFGTLPHGNAGNRVNWVGALGAKNIAPRWDRADPNAVPVVMDLNIVREVKGSMPDVVYPHKQHTEWLDCSNCHPAIFVPQKGANQISMASILMGQQCGVCHGKVAFPVSECRLCHSRKKETPLAASTPASPQR